MTRRLVLFAAATAAACTAAPARAALDVFMLEGDTPVAVKRDVRGVRGAVEALLAGPTRAERRAGLRTSLPGNSRLRNLDVARRIVTVDLSASTAFTRDPRAAMQRLRQLVLTLDGVRGVRGVRVLVEGGTPLGVVPGVDLGRLVTRRAVRPEPPPTLRQLQQRLADLGFMEQAGVSGVGDEQTGVAAMGFQKWAGLPRTGRLDAETVSRLILARRPEPARRRPGRRIEVILDRQLALLEENGKVLRVIHVSSGTSGWGTPAGSFRVYRKEQMSWSIPFRVWMPWASYFYGGIAMHESASVPPYPASHGCVRVTRFDARLVYEFARPGTPVEVMWAAPA